ncbi:hypothetical protein CCP1ISM_60016 [Azospirillaceae bacterium]
MDFDIDLPDVTIDEQQKEQTIKAMLSNDLQKGGIIAKVFIFTYLRKVTAISELTEELRKYYQIDFDRANVWRAAEKLVNNGLLFKATSGFVLGLADSELKDIHKKIIEKHRAYLEGIPKQFRQRYNDVNYVWVSNGNGVKYVPWACKLLGFKYKEKKEK